MTSFTDTDRKMITVLNSLFWFLWFISVVFYLLIFDVCETIEKSFDMWLKFSFVSSLQ